MSKGLPWNGSWRRLGHDEGMGMVSQVRVGLAGPAPASPLKGEPGAPRSGGVIEGAKVDAQQLERPGADRSLRPCGRVKLTRS